MMFVNVVWTPEKVAFWTSLLCIAGCVAMENILGAVAFFVVTVFSLIIVLR